MEIFVAEAARAFGEMVWCGNREQPKRVARSAKKK